MEETEEEIRKLSMELGVLNKEIEDLNKEPEETVETVEESPEPVVVLPSEAADSDTRWPIHMKTILLVSLKFIYSGKATKFCEIFPLLLSYVKD